MAYFANQLDDKERTELAMSDTAINNAMDAAKTFLSSDDDRLKYINRQMAIMDYNSAIRGAREDGFTDGFADGEASGEARGKHNAIIEVAANLLKQGIPLGVITKSTKLSPEEVRQIAKDNGLAF